ncbi:MAG: hypothetical protein MPJ22_05125 [Pirellulales bacterium]|nr:hypothetical protein [Pirellulales bacterium]
MRRFLGEDFVPPLPKAGGSDAGAVKRRRKPPRPGCLRCLAGSGDSPLGGTCRPHGRGHVVFCLMGRRCGDTGGLHVEDVWRRLGTNRAWADIQRSRCSLSGGFQWQKTTTTTAKKPGQAVS